MADSREFILVGSFQDGITPSLERINKQISTLKTNLSGLGGKGARSISRDIGRFTSATKSLSDTLRVQNQVISSTLAPMRQYRVEVGKTIGALNRLNKSGGNVIGIERVNKALQDQIRLMDQLRSRRGGGGGYNSGGGGGGGYSGRRGRRGGGGGYDGGGGGYASAVFGNQIGNMLTGSIVRGFELGVNLMQKPFQAFASALGERISDEMGDLQAAGGIFAIAKRQKDPFVKNFDQAIAFQQEMNLSMAKMANSLPGSTQDFVNVQKRLTDTITRVVTGDVKGSTAISNQIRATEEGKKYYGGQLKTDVTTKAGQDKLIRDNINTMSGELTKLTVLAGLTGGTGGGGGVRGPMGPYGLPGLSERMIADESVSMSGMQRYAAIFRDPAIKDALERHIPKLNAAMKGTPARITAVLNMLREIVTPELVAKLRRSVAGINESLRSTFFSPEAGFLGLGRKLKDMGPMFNDFGQAVDANGNAVKGMTEAARANLSLYEMLRDIYANTMVALMPIVEGLGSIFDPLQAIGNTLKSAREYTAKFLENFYFYRNSLEKYANDLGGLSGKKLTEGLDLRAALLNVNNLFRGLGIFTSKEFEDTTNILLDPSSNPAELIGKMIKKFFSSEAATALGEQIGTTIGTVFKELSTLMSSLADGLGTDLGPGFGRGFKEAGGFDAIQNIFVQLLKMFFSAFATVIKEMPMVALAGVGLALAPALIGAASTALMEGILTGSIGRGRGRGGAGGGRGGGGGGGFFGPTAAMRGARSSAGAALIPAKEAVKASVQGLGAILAKIPGIAQAGKVAKFVPGGAIAGGAIDFALAKATGQSTAKALSGAAGSIIGATVGSALGPIGTVAGGVLGSMAGNAIHDAFTGQGRKQEYAAAVQKQAADLQLQAASKKELTGKYGLPDLQNNFGQAAEVKKRFEALGYASNTLVQSYNKEYFERNNAVEKLKQTNVKLEEMQKKFTAQNLDPKLLKLQLAPFEQSAKTAAAAVKREEAQLTAAMSKLPLTIQQAFSNNIANVSMQEVAAALARKVDQIKINDQNQVSAGYRAENKNAIPPMRPSKEAKGMMKYDGKVRTPRPLSSAIASEMRNKPSGSNLVIANSSETVIPAAGGLGMGGLVQAIFGAAQRTASTITQGFTALAQTTAQGDQSIVSAQKQAAMQTQQAILKSTQAQLAGQQQLMVAIKTSGGGGMPGALGSASVGGGVDAFTGMAAGAGLQLTSGYRPGDPGWHGANRARDYSNGTGPTPQMLQFARALAAKYGSSLKELIYTPLGFSIKNGQQVAPYAQAAHYNHVHVAYALGAGNPALFSNQKDAVNWENKVSPFNVKSVTSNTGELAGLFDGLFGKKPPELKPGEKPTMNELGTQTGYRMLQRKLEMERMMKELNQSNAGPTSINAPITINQQPGQDANALAAIVVAKMSEWVSDARTSSIFV